LPDWSSGHAKLTGTALQCITFLQAEFWFHILTALIQRTECRFFDDTETALILSKDQELFSAPGTLIGPEDPLFLCGQGPLFKAYMLPNDF